MNLEDTLRATERNFDRHNLPRDYQQIQGALASFVAWDSSIKDDNFIVATIAAMPTVNARLVLFAYLGSLPSNPAVEHSWAHLAKNRPYDSGRLDSTKLLKKASRELCRRGFVDYSFVDNGSTAIVLRGVRKDDSVAALRFVGSHKKRLKSIAILPADPIFLPYEQQIEILPLASDRFVPPKNERARIAQTKLWDQRLMYVVSLLHAEGKIAWEYEALNNLNIIQWQDSIWVNDPDRLFRSRRARAINTVAIAGLLKEDVPELKDPRQGRVISAEYFAVLNGRPAEEAQKIHQWAAGEGLHVIDVPEATVQGEYLVVVDPERKRDGKAIAQGMRGALRSKSHMPAGVE